MAEAVVVFVIDKLLPLLTTEASRLNGLQDDLVAINNELRSIKVFLKDAEQRAEENDGIKEWVRQVRSIAHQIEDVIDEYLMLRHRHDHPHHQSLNFLEKLGRHVVQLRPKHRIASTIQRIRSEILEMNRRRSIFSLDAGPSPSNRLHYENLYNRVDQDPRAGFLYVDESELVGIDDPKKDLIRLLDLELQDDRQGKVISVVGMGGLGKTTLVRKVYEDLSLRKQFPFRAWITLSRPGKTLEVIRNMIKQFYRSARDSVPPDIDTIDEESLVDELRYYLQQRRFLVVFDDVWNIETCIKDVLPANGTGSRILLTTRLEAVALAWKRSSYVHVYKLQHLSPEKAWDLFCRKTFQGTEAKCPPELAKLSQDIVRKCEGLPLALVTIGSLLSTKHKVATEWQKLCDSIGAELGNNPHLANIKKILLLSYHDLPHYLKPCFLYMGLLTGECSIDRKRLIKLWIAEGFIPNMTGKTLEEVAEEFLIELVYRSLVQITWVDIAGRPRSFRVHDLLREIILLKSEELSFCQVLDEDNLPINSQSRRLVIQNGKLNSGTMESIKGSIRRSCLRSLFLFDQRCEALHKSIIGSFLKNFCLLKVLDLQDAPVNQISEAVGSLFHLQYFSLRGTKVKKLPRSIGKLENLQTLDLKHSLVEELPTEISKMRKLRHLVSYSYHWDDTFSLHIRNVTAGKIPAAICQNSLEMQNLGWVDGNSLGFLDQLGNLKQLRRLGVARLERKDGSALCKAIKNMHRLQAILVASRNKDEVLDLDHMSSPPMLLRRVLLIGRLEKLPGWISQLENVVKICFCHSGLKDDSFEPLGKLPNLKMLVVSEAYDGETLYFGATRFQKLKILRLFDLYNLKSLTIEPETLPVLEELELGSSPHMEFPTGIQHLKNLTLLNFHDMPENFSDAMTPTTGQHFDIINHVPNVYVNSKAGAGRWESSSLRCPYERRTLLYTIHSGPLRIT